MRLVDADALKKVFNDFYGGVGHAAIATVFINDAPSIEIEEIVHGRWIAKMKPRHFDFKLNCSVCLRGSDLATDFCPYCGADMRGVDDE